MSTPTVKELLERHRTTAGHATDTTKAASHAFLCSTHFMPLLASRVEKAVTLCESVLPGSDRYAQELAAAVLRVLDGGEP